MEIALLSPVAVAVLDTALDAAGGGVPVLACGSGRKLRTAFGHKVNPVKFSPAKPALTGNRACIPAYPNALATMQHLLPHAVPHRQISSLVPTGNTDPSNLTRPFLGDSGALPNPRSRNACSMGIATWVCDPGSILSEPGASNLEEALDHINACTGVQFAAVILNDVQGSRDITRFRKFGVDLFDHWGVGDQQFNNGALLVFFKEERRLEIVTGKGMGSVLSDSWLLEIQLSRMVPLLRSGRDAQGLLAGVHAIREQLVKKAPSSWCQGLGMSFEERSFGGGKALGGAGSLWPTISLFAFALAAGSLSQQNEDPQVQELQDRIKLLQGNIEFVDAMQNPCPWPYAETPSRMADLIAPEDRATNHAFALVRNGCLDVQALATKFGNSSLELKLQNWQDESLNVYLPAGSLFVPKSGHHDQPLLLQEPVHITLQPHETQMVYLDTFCGDSRARVPSNSAMVLSPFRLSAEFLGGQVAVWRWASRYQKPTAQLPCSGAVDILRDSFGIYPEDLVELITSLNQLIGHGEEQRKHELVITERALTARRTELNEQRQRAARSCNSGSSRGFGGGCAGGGAGCSF